MSQIFILPDWLSYLFPLELNYCNSLTGMLSGGFNTFVLLLLNTMCVHGNFLHRRSGLTAFKLFVNWLCWALHYFTGCSHVMEIFASAFLLYQSQYMCGIATVDHWCLSLVSLMLPETLVVKWWMVSPTALKAYVVWQPKMGLYFLTVCMKV